MLRKILFLGCFLFILIALFSCNDRVTTFDPDNSTREITVQSNAIDEIELADEAIIVSRQTMEKIESVSQDKRTITFQGDDAVIKNIKSGQLLVFTVSDETPNGALKRVTSVSESGNQTVVVTEFATIEEVFRTLRLEAKRPLTIDQVEKITYSIPSLNIQDREYNFNTVQKNGDLSFTLPLKHVFASNRDSTAVISIEGEISLEPTLDLLLDVRFFSLREFRVAVENTVSSQLEFFAGIRQSLEPDPIIIFRFRFTPIPFGPVVVSPILDLKVGSKINAEAGLSADASIEVISVGGIEYSDDEWRPIANFDTDFSATMPEFKANAGVRVYAGPELTFLIYELVGPYVNLSGYYDASINLFRQPELQIYSGIEANAGAKVEILGRGLLEFVVPDLYSSRKLVYEKSFANPPQVRTTTITNITPSTATSGGTITDTGGGNITQKGVCWSTSRNPDLSDTCTRDGTGSSSFTSFISDLSDNTRYYVRAYAENSSGAGYGQERSFVTQEADDRTFDMNICNVWQVAQSGGVGVTVDSWNISQIPRGATFDIRFNTYSIPDKLVVEYPVGSVQHDTGWRGASSYNNDPKYPGGISGSGVGQESDLFTKRSQNAFRVVVTGVENNTAWDYQVRCRL